MTRQAGTRAAIAVAGALAFWGPETVAYAIRRNNFSWTDVRILTVVMPVTLFAAVLIFSRAFQLAKGITAIRMLLGVWLLGGLFIMINATLAGGGFAGQNGAVDTLGVIALSLVSLSILATYDGSLGGLFIAILVLVIVWVRGWKSTETRSPNW